MKALPFTDRVKRKAQTANTVPRRAHAVISQTHAVVRQTYAVILSAAKNPRIGLCCCLFFAITCALDATTLAHVRQTKTLRCGINQETAEYSSTDDHGARIAFDTDICQAVAVAILGPKARTIITTYADDVAATAALRNRKIDLIPTQTLDLTHASDPALTFSPPLLYDGVGFLVPTVPELTRADQLANKKICFLGETQVEVALRAWFSEQHLQFLPFPFQEEGEMEAAFVTGNCAALAGDLTRLATTRLAFGPLASRYVLLPDQISQDPLATASRADDPAFAKIVFWTIEVLLNAEQIGLTQHGATQLSSRSEAEGSASASPPPNPALEILTGQTHEIGSHLGLDNAWATQVIAAVGNYGELYNRDLGDGSALKLPRAQNRLYTQGGLMFSLPVK
jgi:general L-amino acid transport system substrate-binding protein